MQNKTQQFHSRIRSRVSPSQRRSALKRRSTRGFTLLECLVAGAMLLVVMALAAQLFAWDARERREAWRRHVAQQEAANVLERVSNDAPGALNAERLGALTLSKESADWLPEGTLRASATAVTSPYAGKRIQIEITWRQSSGHPASPVRLTGWAFTARGSP